MSATAICCVVRLRTNYTVFMTLSMLHTGDIKIPSLTRPEIRENAYRRAVFLSWNGDLFYS